MQSIKDKRLWFCIFAIVALGMLSSLSTINAREYYQQLNQPGFAPPAWLFGPVWTTLYLLLGINFYLIIQHKDSIERNKMLILFIIQLTLNLLWPFIFFMVQLMLLSVIDILLLWCIVMRLWLYSFKYLFSNAILLIPYCLWVSFAVILNVSVWLLN